MTNVILFFCHVRSLEAFKNGVKIGVESPGLGLHDMAFYSVNCYEKRGIT
jgi:hypothetical protein